MSLVKKEVRCDWENDDIQLPDPMLELFLLWV